MSRIYRLCQFAKRVGRSISTLRRWDAGGICRQKTYQGHRYYNESDVKRLLGIKTNERKTVVVCRVSSQNQKDDLKSQVAAMEQFCLSSGIAVDEWVSEIGGGMNFKRKTFLKIMDAIQNGEVSKLLIAHKDRLVRFGFDYFEHLAITNGCEIVVVNQKSLSPQQEVVEDLMAIIHTFSCRLYGLRKYKKDIKKAITDDRN
ncbi:MAG TPA: IS607 family transposase [Thioploca sp.]|nr:IS607 family transposase [Thioploca sp.]